MQMTLVSENKEPEKKNTLNRRYKWNCFSIECFQCMPLCLR